jgi:hypothetical protein
MCCQALLERLTSSPLELRGSCASEKIENPSEAAYYFRKPSLITPPEAWNYEFLEIIMEGIGQILFL